MIFSLDVEVQMQHTSLNVSEENSTITLCAIMTSGALEKSITVNLQTHSITGELFSVLLNV